MKIQCTTAVLLPLNYIHMSVCAWWGEKREMLNFKETAI